MNVTDLQESFGVNLGSTLNPADDFIETVNSTYQTTQNDVVFINLGKITSTGTTHKPALHTLRRRRLSDNVL